MDDDENDAEEEEEELRDEASNCVADACDGDDENDAEDDGGGDDGSGSDCGDSSSIKSGLRRRSDIDKTSRPESAWKMSRQHRLCSPRRRWRCSGAARRRSPGIVRTVRRREKRRAVVGVGG